MDVDFKNFQFQSNCNFIYGMIQCIKKAQVLCEIRDEQKNCKTLKGKSVSGRANLSRKH